MSGAKKLETTWRQILPWRLQKIMIIMINSREVRERMNSSVRWSSGSPNSSELLYERLGIYIGRAVINKSTAMMACLSFLIEAVPRYPEHPDESPATVTTRYLSCSSTSFSRSSSHFFDTGLFQNGEDMAMQLFFPAALSMLIERPHILMSKEVPRALAYIRCWSAVICR